MIQLERYTALRVLHKTIPASTFNRIRLGVIRLETPLRVPLAGLKSIDGLISEQNWVCVDRELHDSPVLAWSHFDVHQRQGLHLPVPCQVSLFHAHAGLIMGSALIALHGSIDAALRAARELNPA